MVLGEPQILGQMKQAVREADEAGTLGTTLHQLFQRSFAVAKEVRTSTEIGAHSISMAAAAVRLAAQLFEDLREIHVLFVGAGEMIELVATHFAARSPKGMAVANRTLERGERLAGRFGAEALRLADLPARLHEFDAVISCTASSLPIIGLGAVERALKARRHRPMFMVDLAVPRDIEPEVARLSRRLPLHRRRPVGAGADRGREAPGRRGAGRGHHRRRRAELRALARPARRGAADPGAATARPTTGGACELARARKLLARGEPVEDVLEALARGLTHKMLHGTLAELHAADGAERDAAGRTPCRACSCARAARDPAATSR